MKSITALRSQHLRFVNCIVTLMRSATGVALVRNFGPNLILMSLFAGEPSKLSDEDGVGQRLNGN